MTTQHDLKDQHPRRDHIEKGRTDIGEGGTGGGMGSVGQQSDDASVEDADGRGAIATTPPDEAPKARTHEVERDPENGAIATTPPERAPKAPTRRSDRANGS